MSENISSKEILFQLGRLVVFSVASYITMKLTLDYVNPNSDRNKKAEEKAKMLFEKIGIKIPKLTEHEHVLAAHLVAQTDIPTSWEDIGGLSETVKEIKQAVIYPLMQQRSGNVSKLMQPPRGVLLYGPPGCGKTLLARAIARESGAAFLNIDVSVLTDKWYGESQKLTAALFSLAYKIQPCIIFIDEIDAFLRNRTEHDHEATALMKAQFLQKWEGLESDGSSCIIIMGATNRPNDVDKAILRRMPCTYQIPKPKLKSRKEIIKLTLKGEKLEDDVDYDVLAEITKNYSGADIHEFCRNAAVSRLYENELEPADFNNLRPLTMDDLIQSIQRCNESHLHNNGQKFNR